MRGQTIMKSSEIKNKADFAQFIKEQINIEITNDETDSLNGKKNVLYTRIPDMKERLVLSLLAEYNVRVAQHRNNYYWIYIKTMKKVA